MSGESQLGEILIKAGVVGQDKVKEAMLLQKGDNTSLSHILVEQGWATEQEIVQAIARSLHRDSVNVKDALISQKVVQLVPKALAIKHNILPLFIQNTTLYLAMENPLDIDVIQQIEFSTGKQVIPLVAPLSQLREAVRKHYNISEYVGNLLENVTEEHIQLKPQPAKPKEGEPIQSGDESERNEIVKLSSLIFAEGIKARASDIHIELLPNQANVRYRIDGMMTGGIKLPHEIYGPLLSRIKVLSGMDMTDHRNPQNGHIQVTYDTRKVDFRVSTVLSNVGEKIVIRILDKQTKFDDITRLGLLPEQLSIYHTLLQQPHGLILATGPTGSGKTTTLYALLNAMRDRTKNIITIEDPIEYQLEGITQLQVNFRIGQTYANRLQAILRQDPDLILLGEIRDAETASAAIQASETGHLVLSTLHTNDAVATVSRLVTLGISPDRIAANLRVAVAQRLVRRICPRCCKEYAPDVEELQRLGLHTKPMEFMLSKGEGCQICRKTSYYGQIGIFEMFIPNEQLRNAIVKQTPKQELKRLAIEAGMKTMLASGLELLRQRITTTEEIVRVCELEHPAIAQARQIPEDQKPPTTSKATKPSFQSVVAEACEQCGTPLEKTWLMCPVCGKQRAKVSGTVRQPEDQDPQILLQEDILEKGNRILVADDSSYARKVLQTILQRREYQITLAVDGEDALEKIFSERPDLVILDINMPKRDGFSVCKAMRSRMDTMLIPVILLTAQTSIESKLQGLSLGADDYITKPFHPDELLARIEGVLRRSSHQQMA